MVKRKTPMKETAEDKAVTQKALENSGAKLLEYVEGLEEIAERMGDLKQQVADKMRAAKVDGYDPKAIRAAVRERAKTEEQRAAAEEFGAVVQTYLDALDAVAVVE